MSKQNVLPGEFLCTEEEFSPGREAFEEEGNVYTSVCGTPNPDSKMKEMNVEPQKQLRTLHPGSTVLGRVMLVKENSVSVTLLQMPDNRIVISKGHAMLPIRNVSRDYVENLKDAFKIGDLVKAKVTRANKYGIDLATNEPGLGVVKAFCSKCRNPMQRFGRALRCLTCGSSENRKVSADYFVK